MEIHELTERQSTLDTGVYLPVDDGDVTQKIDYPRLAQAIIEQYTASSLGGSYRSIKTALDAIKTTVDGKVNTSDVVNNLVTTAAGKVLDARQGKALNDATSTLNTNNAGTRINIATGGSYNAIKITSSQASLENRFFFFGIGSSFKTIVFNLYFRPDASTPIVVENLGETAVKANIDGTDSNSVIVTTGNYCNGVMICQQRPSGFTLSYTNSTGITLNTNSIAGIGDGTVLGAISTLAGWSAMQTITSQSYGSLVGRYNKGSKVATIRWAGNSTQITAGTHTFSLPADFKPFVSCVVPLKPNGYMEVRVDGTITVTLDTAIAWSAGTITYVLE